MTHFLLADCLVNIGFIMQLLCLQIGNEHKTQVLPLTFKSAVVFIKSIYSLLPRAIWLPIFRWQLQIQSLEWKCLIVLQYFMKCLPGVQINNKSAFVRVMAWFQKGDKQLPDDNQNFWHYSELTHCFLEQDGCRQADHTFSVLTPWDLAMHICIIGLDHHWFR